MLWSIHGPTSGTMHHAKSWYRKQGENLQTLPVVKRELAWGMLYQVTQRWLKLSERWSGKQIAEQKNEVIFVAAQQTPTECHASILFVLPGFSSKGRPLSHLLRKESPQAHVQSPSKHTLWTQALWSMN